MKLFPAYITIPLLALLCFQVAAQKVTVSREIGIKGNYAYDILPNIGGRIIVYHDKGSEHEFEIYDNELRYINTIQPQFEKKHIQPTGIVTMDSAFHYYYTYRENDSLYYRVNIYDGRADLLDSLSLSAQDKKLINSNARFAHSKDKSKVLIFNPDDRGILMQLIDNHNFRLLSTFRLQVKDINLKTDFEKVLVTNDGEILVFGRKNSFWEKSSSGFFLVRCVNKDDTRFHSFLPEKDNITEFLPDYDEINNRLALAGLISESSDNAINGYFGFSIKMDSLPEEAEILVNRFSPEFIQDVTGRKSGKSRDLSDFKLQDMVIRRDGGVVLIAEVVREFMRRSQMNSPLSFGNPVPARGFIDYYHEDLIMMATHPDGKEHWNKVLFKKQFSQDDNANFSSYFIFKTPTRMKLLYNDAIKNDITVSEYVIDPLGNMERKSVLSTEYQNLKLRFRDAIQTGPRTLIVPSEKGWKISLVKIEYE